MVMVCDQFRPCKKYQVPNKISAKAATTKSVATKLENVFVPVKTIWKKLTAKNIASMIKIIK